MFRDYIGGTGGANDASLDAAAHIDVLTFCRIGEFSELTDYQQKTVLRVHESLTRWETENADLLDCPLASYSVNGVSMSFNGKIKSVSGIAIPGELYSLLCTTGLCCPVI